MDSRPLLWRKLGLAFGFLALLATLLLRQSLLPGYTLLPLDLIHTIKPWGNDTQYPLQNPLISDPFYSFYPRRYLFTVAIRDQQFLLWNPAIMSGTPTIANPNFQPFYPPNILAALSLPAHQSLPWLAWLHLVLTGILMFLWLERHRLVWSASLLGASVWMLNGYTLVWLENPHRLSTLAWLPGLFWALDSAVEKKRVGWAVLGGLMLGMAILGGQMQFIFTFGLLLGFYGLLVAAGHFWRKRRIPWRIILYLAIIAGIGLGIGSLVLLPAWEFAEMSQRLRLTAEELVSTRWPLNYLVTLIAPDFYGNPVRTSYWGLANFAETCAYAGGVTLFLALAAPLVARPRQLVRRAGWLALMVLALVLGSPLARLITLLPGAQFMVLNRTLFLVPFVGSLLAAAALDGWLHELPGRRRRLALALVAAAVALLVVLTSFYLGPKLTQHQASILPSLGRAAILLAVLGLLLGVLRKQPRLLGALVVLLAAGDLLQWGWDFNPISPVSELYPENAVVDFLQQRQQEGELFRVLPLQSEAVIFGPNVLSLFGLSTIGGYTPLITNYYHDLFKSIDDEVDIWWMRPNRNMLVMSNFNPLVSLLNVRYVLSARPLSLDIIPQTSSGGCAIQTAVESTPVSQSFVADDPGLNRIDIRFLRSAEYQTGAVEFWLWRDQSQGDLVAQITVPASDLPEDGYYPFFFEPVPDSAGETFVLGISGDADGVQFCQPDSSRVAFAAFATWLQERAQVDGVWIYENPNVAPRAFMVHHVVTRPEDQVLPALNSPDFNWYHSAIMVSPLPDEQEAQLSDTPVRSTAVVQIQQIQPQQVDIQVETPRAGLLVLGDSYYPGWQVKVDGEETPVYRVDKALRGAFVPAGTHSVQFQFRSTSLNLALWVCAASLLGASLLLTSRRRIDRQPESKS